MNAVMCAPGRAAGGAVRGALQRGWLQQLQLLQLLQRQQCQHACSQLHITCSQLHAALILYFDADAAYTRLSRVPCRSQVVGMGLLLTFIGLQTSKIVVADAETMVTMGDLLGLEPVLAISGLAIIASLHFRNVKGSIIIGILVTALAYFAIKNVWPTT